MELRLELASRGYGARASLAPEVDGNGDLPLIVALHGGTYTSRYFDLPGFSLIARAAALGLPIVALDRPGYGGTGFADEAELTHAGNAAVLSRAFADLWERHGKGRAGIVLIGHSIGGAIALRIAALGPAWPLIGIAVSGLGLRNAPSGAPMRAALPLLPFIDLPAHVKDRQMFGPEGSFVPRAVSVSYLADAPAPRQELVDISTDWPRQATAILGRVRVPIHYRQADGDALWVSDRAEVRAFAAACTGAPLVDAALVGDAGHCIDFHRIGASFQLDQLSFALRCAVRT